MIDVVDSETRSRMMAGIRGKNTRPEMLVRRFLHGHGFRYRLHVKRLPGQPDLALPKWRVVILVHGCFWHRHEGCRYSTMPTSNVEHWRAKFQDNVVRDRRNVRELLDTGWSVIILWECGLRAVKMGRATLNWLPEQIINAAPSRLREWPAAHASNNS